MSPQDAQIVAAEIARAQLQVVIKYLQVVELGASHDAAAAAMVRCFEETNLQLINIVQTTGAPK